MPRELLLELSLLVLSPKFVGKLALWNHRYLNQSLHVCQLRARKRNCRLRASFKTVVSGRTGLDLRLPATPHPNQFEWSFYYTLGPTEVVRIKFFLNCIDNDDDQRECSYETYWPQRNKTIAWTRTHFGMGWAGEWEVGAGTGISRWPISTTSCVNAWSLLSWCLSKPFSVL